MKILCIKYFQHINKIISIMQPNLVQKTKHFKSAIHIENREQRPIEQLLEQELLTLKQNIQNLLKYSHRLQKHIKISKISLPSTNDILEQNHYEIGSADFPEQKSFTLAGQSYLSKQKNFVQMIQRQNEELKKTRQLYLGSINKIHQLKSQISNLTQKLNHFAEVYELSNLKETTMMSRKDLLTKELSMSQNVDKYSHSQHDDIDIETLLCHEDLDMDSPLLKENYSLRSNREHHIIQSLISKGIEFRDQRSLKSNEFRELSTIVERYREQSLSNFKPIQMRKYKSTSYR